MTGKTIDLEFEGCWREAYKAGVPARSGIYCVYSCTPSTVNGKTTLTLHKLIYIGESSNVRARLASHNKLADWSKHLEDGQVLCYTVATVVGEDERFRAEAALINKFTPPENTEYVGNFPFNKTTVNCTGVITYLLSTLTVE